MEPDPLSMYKGARPKPLSEHPRAAVRYPSWMDAPFVVRASKLLEGEELITDASGTAVVPGNPLRWAITICAWLNNGAAVTLSPFNHREDYAAFRLQAGASVSLTLFAHGLIVCYPLLVLAAPGLRVRYYETGLT